MLNFSLNMYRCRCNLMSVGLIPQAELFKIGGILNLTPPCKLSPVSNPLSHYSITRLIMIEHRNVLAPLGIKVFAVQWWLQFVHVSDRDQFGAGISVNISAESITTRVSGYRFLSHLVIMSRQMVLKAILACFLRNCLRSHTI